MKLYQEISYIPLVEMLLLLKTLILLTLYYMECVVGDVEQQKRPD
ncbi:hypothetical protein [Ureibacillus sp. FSL W8-0352]